MPDDWRALHDQLEATAARRQKWAARWVDRFVDYCALPPEKGFSAEALDLNRQMKRAARYEAQAAEQERRLRNQYDTDCRAILD